MPISFMPNNSIAYESPPALYVKLYSTGKTLNILLKENIATICCLELSMSIISNHSIFVVVFQCSLDALHADVI